MKNLVSDIKNTWNEINSLDTVEGKISNLENRAVRETQTDESKLVEKNRSPRDPWEKMKWPNILVIII